MAVRQRHGVRPVHTLVERRAGGLDQHDQRRSRLRAFPRRGRRSTASNTAMPAATSPSVSAPVSSTLAPAISPPRRTSPPGTSTAAPTTPRCRPRSLTRAARPPSRSIRRPATGPSTPAAPSSPSPRATAWWPPRWGRATAAIYNLHAERGYVLSARQFVVASDYPRCQPVPQRHEGGDLERLRLSDFTVNDNGGVERGCSHHRPERGILRTAVRAVYPDHTRCHRRPRRLQIQPVRCHRHRRRHRQSPSTTNNAC